MTNLSSGLLLQARAAVAAGDLICVNEVLGTVLEINARSVVIETADGRTVHVPNADVVNETIENFSALGRRRSTFEVTVDARTDLDQVIGTIERSVASITDVLDEPPPMVALAGVVGRYVVLQVRVWHGPLLAAERSTVSAAVRGVVADCTAAGISLTGPELLAVEPAGPSA